MIILPSTLALENPKLRIMRKSKYKSVVTTLFCSFGYIANNNNNNDDDDDDDDNNNILQNVF